MFDGKQLTLAAKILIITKKTHHTKEFRIAIENQGHRNNDPTKTKIRSITKKLECFEKL